VNHEWHGRLTSILQTNVSESQSLNGLKFGNPVNIFQSGELWRAQVIIPKTSSDTVLTNQKVLSSGFY
jgi:hypothetical protein